MAFKWTAPVVRRHMDLVAIRGHGGERQLERYHFPGAKLRLIDAEAQLRTWVSRGGPGRNSASNKPSEANHRLRYSQGACHGPFHFHCLCDL
jgi:hypothetical protein